MRPSRRRSRRPAGRAGRAARREHHDRLDELPAPHRPQPRQTQQVPVLQVARKPAQLAAQEFRQRRRVGLPRSALVRQHANAPAGAAQHRRLDLVVRQDVPTVRQRRQPAVRAKGRDAHHRVVSPIGTFIALPPRLPGRPGAHPRPHAELEQPREGGGCRQSHGQVLRDRQRRIGLHGPHQAQHRRRRHLGIGVERQHQLEPRGVVVQEVHDVAGLEAGVGGPPAIADAPRIAILGTKRRHRLLFGCRRLGIPRVGQDEHRERVACAGQVQLMQQPPQRRQHAAHVLVAHRHRDRGARQRRIVCRSTGKTARTGSRRAVRMMNPIRPFARHSPVHGAVPANATSMTSFAGSSRRARGPAQQCAEAKAGQQRKQHDNSAAKSHAGSFRTILSWHGEIARGSSPAPDIGISFVLQRSCHCPPDRVAVIDAITRPTIRRRWLIRAGRPIFPPDMQSEPRLMANTETAGAGAGDGAHRLSRRRQDHAAEPHPHRAARPQIRGGDQRVRRAGRGQRPRRGHRRGSVRDEQRLHLLHGARRPDPHRGRADEAA